MGGALDVPGNTSPVAEFNCYADPYAAAAVMEAVKKGAFRFVFAPLDVTTPHQIPFKDLLHPSFADVGIDPKSVPPPTPLERFATSFLLRVRSLQAKFGLPDAMEMHDPVAVWYGIEPESFAVAGKQFGIERKGELTRGMCVVDRRGGDSNGKTRTEDSELLRRDVHSHHKPAVPDATEDDDDDDDDKNDSPLPLAITRTPGSEALRKKLLSRVFGKNVDQ